MKSKPLEGLARVGEAIQFLGLSKGKLYLMMEAGEIAFVKFGKCRRISWSELHQLVERNTVSTSKH